MTQPLDFQSMILTLHHYWDEHGCLIWHPYYSQVGAGTMNPATFLRVLGPEPWNTAYVEPSVRPDDGRYGENPNRLQMFYQYQVILKPDPGNPQELYLGSLEALGIDLQKNDIRFVEDNWEQPAIGAWGLGWEVWLNGLEITQFTYFQQTGGQTLDPVSVEITYGLDRIAAPLQGKRGFQNIQWNHDRTFGDMNLQGEQEHSKYYNEVAGVARLREMNTLLEKEADDALKQGLVLPAHDYILKLSHNFNVLDTRGAIGVTDRQAFFGRMRKLSRRVAEAYLEQREGMGYPWLGEEEGKQGNKETGKQGGVIQKEAADFLLEVGTEELPQGDLDGALAQLGERVPEVLGELRLEHGSVQVLGTPRRLVVHVEGLAPRQTDVEELAKGPPAERAFDAEGKPTKAAQGFARGKGIDVKDLEVREMDGGEYVVALVREAGRPAAEALAEALPDLIAGLRFPRSMRWNHTKVAFSRPVRWLLGLFGGQVVPFEFAGMQSGNTTRGLRFHQPETFTLDSPADYFAALAKQDIILDQEERKAKIEKEIGALAAEAGGEAVSDPALLDEVANLVEAPIMLLGTFDESYLSLPREVLVSVMKKHQRYFPVEKDGKLLPYFIVVGNGKEIDETLVVEGNAEVIRARFADAGFFVEEDRKRPLAEYLPQLETLMFQKDLGSMLDKTDRITKLVVDYLAEFLRLTEKEKATAKRAAELCKADLATNMVVEMTSLQGIMGSYYALASGESEEVATAIREHYLPRHAGDDTPKTKPGLAVGLADRLDTLAGLFAAGLEPTSTKDPFALRRAARGLVSALIAWDLDFDLRAAIANAGTHLSKPDGGTSLEPDKVNTSQVACLDFIVGRLNNLLREEGHRYDVVAAALAVQGHNPASVLRAVTELGELVAREDWDTIFPAYSRCVRITRDLKEQFSVDPKRFVEEAEKTLYALLQEAEAKKRAPGSVNDFYNAFEPLIPHINSFFDDVLVMAEDVKLRENRLGLVQRIAALAEGVADLSHLEGF